MYIEQKNERMEERKGEGDGAMEAYQERAATEEERRRNAACFFSISK